MTAPEASIEVRNLAIVFSRWGQEVRALDGLELSVPAGQWLMLVGHNGSGKSTLLKALTGRIAPDLGSIQIAGQNIATLKTSRIADHVFLVHQDPLLGTAPKLTLFENLMVADHEVQVGHIRKRALVAKYEELLRPLGLETRLKQLAQSFSGGERQLLALLIARLRPAPIMMLDEPLAALDPGKAELCLGLIRDLSQSGKTVIQVTHDPTLALSGGDRTVLLRKGKVVYDMSSASRDLAALSGMWSAETD
ncbi:MAG: ATP-binding cassette domain-containing protein [bacterium]